jgi:hypothetical protein
MAYTHIAHSRDFAAVETPRRGRSLWRRIYDALVEGRRAAAEREVAIYLHRSGGKFTDSAEREIERIMMSSHQRR